MHVTSHQAQSLPAARKCRKIRPFCMADKLSSMRVRWQKLSANYIEARAVYERELPNLVKSQALLPKLMQEAQTTMQVLHDARKELKTIEQAGR